MNEEIDLGQSPEQETGPIQNKSAEMDTDLNFPELHIDQNPDSGIEGLPDEGEFAIHGKVVHRQTHIHPTTGRKKYSAKIRVHSIKHIGKHKSHKHHGDVASRMEGSGFPASAVHD